MGVTDVDYCHMPGTLILHDHQFFEHRIHIVVWHIEPVLLKTNERIGYVVLDVDKKLSVKATELLRDVKATIKVRLLY